MFEFIKHVTSQGFSVKFVPHPTHPATILIEYAKDFMRVTGPCITIELLEQSMPGILNVMLMETFNEAKKVFTDGIKDFKG